ncbi:MAG: hypothetical protein HQ538_06685 [Parcubacteria group bacterium]|nr:hypothetical protein [Parcubacteria group bacterium]
MEEETWFSSLINRIGLAFIDLHGPILKGHLLRCRNIPEGWEETDEKAKEKIKEGYEYEEINKFLRLLVRIAQIEIAALALTGGLIAYIASLFF